MNLINVLKIGVACAALVFSYWIGVQQGRESEELKNARLEISALERTIEKYQGEQDRLSNSLADIRVSESRTRDEYEWMRQQLSLLESRAAKNNAAGECIRFQRLAVEKEQLLNEAQRGLEFCYKNHR